MARRKKKIEEQMDIFADGGLKDEGGSVDPVSGNDVPVGSTQEEVRDDIPAQLSEGEFVFPADVVRYIGLENLMQLRQKAKEGLQQMDDMGQMGNSEEAVLDDDIEYNAEIDMLIDGWNPDEGELEMAEGGVVYAQRGQYIPGISLPQQNSSSGYRAPTTEEMIFGGGSGQSPLFGVQSPVTYTSEEYIGPSGERITITFINGKPVYPIPEGYKKYDPTKAVKEAPVVAQPKVQQTDGDGGDGPPAATNNMGTLGYQGLAEAVSVQSEVNPKLDKAFANKPKGIKDVIVKGLIPSLISSVNFGIEESKAIKAVESGYGLTDFDVDSTYGKWRSGLDNGYLAASMLETENEAREIVDGDDFDIQGSSFGSYEEAEAVAKHGVFSDQQIDAITDQFDNLPTTTGGDSDGGTSPTASGGSRTTDAADVDSGRGGMGPSGSGPSDSGQSDSGGSSDSFGGGRDSDGWGE